MIPAANCATSRRSGEDGTGQKAGAAHASSFVDRDRICLPLFRPAPTWGSTLSKRPWSLQLFACMHIPSSSMQPRQDGPWPQGPPQRTGGRKAAATGCRARPEAKRSQGIPGTAANSAPQGSENSSLVKLLSGMADHGSARQGMMSRLDPANL